VPDARESRDAYVSRVEDEGRSQSVCSIHVCMGIYIPTLTLYMSDRKREKAVASEGVNYGARDVRAMGRECVRISHKSFSIHFDLSVCQ